MLPCSLAAVFGLFNSNKHSILYNSASSDNGDHVAFATLFKIPYALTYCFFTNALSASVSALRRPSFAPFIIYFPRSRLNPTALLLTTSRYGRVGLTIGERYLTALFQSLSLRCRYISPASYFSSKVMSSILLILSANLTPIPVSLSVKIILSLCRPTMVISLTRLPE